MKTLTTLAFSFPSPSSFAHAACSDHFKWIYLGSRADTKHMIHAAIAAVHHRRPTSNDRYALKQAFRYWKRKLKKYRADTDMKSFTNIIYAMDHNEELCYGGSDLMKFRDSVDAIVEYTKGEILKHMPNASSANRRGCGYNCR